MIVKAIHHTLTETAAKVSALSTVGGGVATWFAENASLFTIGFTGLSALSWIYFSKLGNDLKKKEDARREEEIQMQRAEHAARMAMLSQQKAPSDESERA
jgi:hypothetical protein